MIDEQQVFLLLQTVATKLGVTVDSLWGILLKQVRVEAIYDLAVGAILVIITVIVYNFANKKCTVQLGQDYAQWEGDESISVFNWIFAVIMISFSFFFLFEGMYELILSIYNPEYWAFNRLLNILKGGC